MLEIKDTLKFSLGMICLLLSAVLFLFGSPLVALTGIYAADYLLGLGFLAGGTWLVDQSTDGSWRRN